MSSELARPPAARRPLIERLDPRVGLIAAFALVLVVVLTPLTALKPLAFEGFALAFLVGVSGVEPSRLFRRWLAILPVVVFLVLTTAPGNPSRRALGLGGVAAVLIAKNAVAVLGLLAVTGALAGPKLLRGLRGLGVPPLLLATFAFMERYVHVLREELRRMTLARRARWFRHSRLDRGILTGLVGTLLLRSLERADRIQSAMIARGWDGSLEALDGIHGP